MWATLATSNPLVGSCVNPRRFKLGFRELISSEAVVRGKLLTLGILTRDQKGCRQGGGTASGRCLPSERGRALPGSASGRTDAGTRAQPDHGVWGPPGLGRPRTPAMLPAWKEACGERGSRAKMASVPRGLGAAPRSSRSSGSHRARGENCGILRPDPGLAGYTARLGNYPGRGGGGFLGQLVCGP